MEFLIGDEKLSRYFVLSISVILILIDLFMLFTIENLDPFGILFILPLIGLAYFSKKLGYIMIMILTPIILFVRHIIMEIPFRLGIDGFMTLLIIVVTIIFAEFSSLSRKYYQVSLELQHKEEALKNALEFVRVCAYCKKIKDEEMGYISWEEFMTQFHSAKYSHGICNICLTEQRDKVN